MQYQWNDVALLTDQRACTFLCKTMLRIPEEETIQLQEITLTDWHRSDLENIDPQAQACSGLSGVMQLQLRYKNQQDELETEQIEIPLRGVWKNPEEHLGEAQLLYSRWQNVDAYLLLETVLQIRRELELQPTQVLVGQFFMEESLTLPDSWPGCADVLTTAAVAEVQSCHIEQQMLQVQGAYHLTVVYVDDAQPGERLFAYQQSRSFLWQMAVPAGLQELTGVQPYYQSLAVQLLHDREIELRGTGVLCTPPITSDLRQTGVVETEVMEREVLKTEVPAESHEAIPEPVVPMKVENNEQRSRYAKHVPHTPSVINSRGSRRANLSKYMRDLNGMVQSPNSIRNFEIGQGTEEIEESEETEYKMKTGL